MFDPSTLCFEINYPWSKETFIRIWHEDPCTDGSDNSCDWHGSKRPLSAKEKAISESVWKLETILDNRPFFPDHPAHLRFQEVKQAIWEWRKREGFRIHPRWHIWHWRIQVIPYQNLKRWIFERCVFCGKRFSWRDVKRGHIMGSWDGDTIWHFGCDKHTRKDSK